MARPTKYTEKLAEKICERIASGETVRGIGRDPKMPDAATIFRWAALDHEGFHEQYARAREVQAENMFEEIVEIADGASDVIKSGAEKKSGAFAQVERNRVDTRKWYLSKVLPKKFGERNVHVTEDKDGNTMPIGGNQIEFASQNDKKDSKTDSK